VHANKLRKFHVRVQGCNVISESDVDFGRVLVPNVFIGTLNPTHFTLLPLTF